MAGPAAVVGPAAQRRALDRLARGGAGQRGGVQQPQRILGRGGAGGQVRHDLAEQPAGLPQAFVVAGLVGQIGEQVPQPAVAEPDPAVLVMTAKQDLSHGQGDQFAVGQAWSAAGVVATGIGPQQVVDDAVQCGDEVVEGGVHEASQEVDVATATPTLGGLVSPVTAHTDSESII